MPRRRRSRPAALALSLLASAALLAGCAADGGAADDEPLFASEEEAFEAAVEVYEDYLEVTNRVARAGGEGADAFRAVATGTALESALDGAQSYVDSETRTTGDIVLLHVELLEYEPDSVEILACTGYQNVDLLDAEGNSVVSPDRPSTQTFRVEVSGSATPQVSSREFTSSGTTCAG